MRVMWVPAVATCRHVFNRQPCIQQAGRQADKQASREVGRWGGRPAGRQVGKPAGRQAGRLAGRRTPMLQHHVDPKRRWLTWERMTGLHIEYVHLGIPFQIVICGARHHPNKLSLHNTNAPYQTDVLWGTLRVLGRPGRARTELARPLPIMGSQRWCLSQLQQFFYNRHGLFNHSPV